MGNCVVQCYPCLIKSNLENQQSSLFIPPIINEIEDNYQNNNNKNIMSDNNNLNENEKKKDIIDKKLNYGPTLEKNEHEENANENINIETGHRNFLNLNLNLNKENMNKRRRSIFSEHQNSISNKYNKLQSFSRQLSTESFLRAKTKGDKIIDNIPKHLGPKQISWGSGGQNSKMNSLFGRTGSDLPLSSKYNHYLKKITEQAEEKKVKRLSVINEDETEEDKGNSTVIMKDRNDIELNYNNKLVKKLKNVNLIKNNLNKNQINNLSSIINEYEIQSDMDIFWKGEIGSSLFILEAGELKLYNNSPDKYITIKDEYNFGEVCLINNEEIKRKFCIASLTKTKIFVLEKDKFNNFLIKENIIIKSVDISVFNNVEFFKDFPENELNLLSKFCYIIDEKDYQNNKSEVTYITFKEFFNLDIRLCLSKHFIKIDIIEINFAKTIVYRNNENGNNGNKNNSDDKKEKENEQKKYLIIPVNVLFELYGFDMKRKIVQYSFILHAKKDDNFLNYFKINQLNSTTFYSIFKLKCLNKGNSLKIKLSNKDFMIFLIDGTVSFYNNEDLIEEYNAVCFLDTKNIKNKNKMFFKITTIILYANYDDISSKSKELQNIYNHKLSIYHSFTFLNLLEEEELFSLISSISQKSYKKNDILINEEHKCENFYLIISGEVKHKFYNEETVIRFSDGECFGEIFLLDGDGEFLKDSFVVVTSEKLSTFEIPKELFFELLQKPKINDYIKVKMCLEDKSILLSDLYYLAFLGKGKFGNVYLVHNGIFIYAIKIVSRSFIKNTSKAWKYLQNENNILKLLNFQFIIKLVKTFKTKDFVFFLMEYSTGSQLDEVLDILTNRTTINMAKFYGGILFLILDYLSKQKIIHRDIKPSNIMVDTNGYIKLVDFGAAKRILNGYAKTMIGTPFYMAPEIIAGKNYSFASDYFSVGVCLYYIYYKKYPFGMGMSDVYLIYQDILKKPVSFQGLNNQNNLLNDLIKHLLDKEPALRISCLSNVKSHPFYKDYDWDLLFAKKINPPYLPSSGRNYTEQYLKNVSKPFEEFIEEEKNILIKIGNQKASDMNYEESESINADNSWNEGF